jgi:hypothetical protein
MKFKSLILSHNRVPRSLVTIGLSKGYPVLLLIAFLLSGIQAFACDCPVHPGKLTKSKTDSFDVILRGKIILPFPCSGKESQTRFEGLELFKGMGIPRILEVTHDCKSACRMPFEKEQEWLLFIKSDTSKGTYRVTYCERNRLAPTNVKNDDYTLYNEMSYQEELIWLRQNMLPVYFLEPEEVETVIKQDLTIIDQNRNIRFATDTEKVFIVAGSFLFMIVLIWVMRRILK